MSGLAAAALVWTVGGALAALALATAGLAGRRLALYAVALAPGVGCGLASLVYFFALVAGLGRPGVLAFLAVGLAVAAPLAAAARRRRHAASAGAAAAAPAGTPVAAPVAVLAWSALAVSVVVGGRMLWRLAHVWPEGTWDAVAIWNVRARFLYAGAGDVAALLARVEPSSHPHYPLLLPGAIAAQYAIAGGEAAWTPRLVALAFTVGLALLAFAVAADGGSPAAAALAAALVAGTPLVWLWGAAQVADVAVAYLFLAALAVLASQLAGHPAAPLPPFLGGFLLGLLAWSKNEGLVMAAILGGLLAAGLLLAPPAANGRRRWPVLAAVALGALPGLAALVAFKLLWAPPGTGTDTFLGGVWADRLADPQRWWAPLAALLARFVPLGEAAASWSLLWPTLLAGLVAAWVLHRGRPRPWLALWTAALAAVVASWVPIYAITPYDQAWHIAGSIDRLLLQVMPAAAVGVALAAAAALRGEARPPARRAR